MPSAAAAPLAAPERPAQVDRTPMLLALALLLWLVALAYLGSRNVFLARPGQPPLGLAAAAVTPLLAFAAAWRLWPAFRRLALGADVRVLTVLQAWRLVGFGFIALHVQGVLPGVFAWPAGLGDMAIALEAPLMLRGLLRHAGFIGDWRFLAWNLLGILDLLVALTLGALASGLSPALSGPITTAPLAQLPLLLIPGCLVPLMLMAHLTTLLQRRAWRAQRGA
jgi:hypothetical protein